MMIQNLNNSMDSLTAFNLLSQEALADYLPVKLSDQRERFHQKEIEFRLIWILRRFGIVASEQQNRAGSSLILPLPDDYDEDWRWILLLCTQICLCQYSLEKNPEFSDCKEQRKAGHKLRVYIRGLGRQPILCRALLIFLWPRFCQFRYSAWLRYTRGLRRKTGGERRITPVVRENWRRKFCLQWISALWSEIQMSYTTHIASGENV
ncbi:hypothetical protein ACV772_003625 [Proteus mirabilis]|nr:hypothetical protein [Escherichia coli]EKU2367722.1 hypothetical protein [Proteus mirabilis]HBU0172484.1 hypothetical protein [Klebsiella pneumoniae]EJY1963154.1 hypothetical protein [Escherichia coli]EKU7915425.1 hypothetical protein [Proteus mirabilis]